MKTLEVVAAIIIQDGHVLGCQRGEHRYIAYKYEFPGGKVEPDESQEEALIREIQEELNVVIEPLYFFKTVRYPYPTFTVHLHTYICQIRQGTIELKEHVNSEWFNRDTIYSKEWAEADIPILSDLIVYDYI